MRLIILGGFLLALLPCIFFHPYIGVLLYSWISFMSVHRLLWDFPAVIPPAMVTGVLAILTWLLSKEPKLPPLNATVWLLLLFMVDISITTSQAMNPIAFDVWQQTMKELLFVLVTITLTTNRIRFQSLIWVMVVSLGYYGLKGGVQTILHGGSWTISGPPDSYIANNNDIGAGLVVALPLINYLRISSANRRVRIALLVVMVATFVAVIGTYSRGAAVGLAAVSLFLWLRSGRKLTFGPFIALTIVSAVAFMPQEYMDRINTIQTYQTDGSAVARLEVWGAALDIAKALPLTGAGFRATESPYVIARFSPGIEPRAVHNIFLGVMAEHGFVGFLIWGGLLFVGWRNTSWIVRRSKDRPEWQWAGEFGRMCQVSLVGYCVVGLFGNYEYWDYYFTIIALLAAARTMIEHAPVLRRLPIGARAAMSTPAYR